MEWNGVTFFVGMQEWNRFCLLYVVEFNLVDNLLSELKEPT